MTLSVALEATPATVWVRVLVLSHILKKQKNKMKMNARRLKSERCHDVKALWVDNSAW